MIDGFDDMETCVLELQEKIEREGVIGTILD